MASFNDTIIETFRANDGVLGGHWEGKESLLLHTPGRKSGKEYVNPLVAIVLGMAFLGERPATFWLRRMLADTSVHHADAALTAGTAFEIAPDLAGEAISEGLELLSAPGAASLKPALDELRGDGQTLQLRPAEQSTGWLITRTPGGVRWERRTADGDVVVSGAVRDLLLMCSRRIATDDARITITGDRALLTHWWAHTAF